MEELSLNVLDRLKVFDQSASGEILPLYQTAIKDLELEIADYLCIRDLVQIAEADDPALHALLIMMFAQFNEGSLCLKIQKQELKKMIKRRLGLSNAESLADSIFNNLADAKYATIIGASAADYLPLIFSDGYLYFQTSFKSRVTLALSLSRLAKIGLTPILEDLSRLKPVLKETLEDQPIRMNGKPVVLNNEQKKALILSLVSPVTIISGGPGTGKTSIIIAILRVLIRCGIKAEGIRLTAPTGRAAMRIKETVSNGCKALGNRIDNELADIRYSTIHRLLGYNAARNGFVHSRHNPIQANVVFIDEVSMVDPALMSRLLDALPPHARVVFLGDQDQLPSVEAGAVMADLLIEKQPNYSRAFKEIVRQLDANLEIQATDSTNSLSDKIVLLNETYRSEKSILKVAGGIKKNEPESEIIGRIPLLTVSREEPESAQRSDHAGSFSVKWPVPVMENQSYRCQEGGCWRIAVETLSETDFNDIIRSWVVHHYLRKSYGFDESYRTLVMMAAREITAGIESSSNMINVSLSKLFQLINRARILSLVRKGPFGCQQINEVALEQFNAGRPGNNVNGVPILITHNAYNLQLFNGDVGVLLRSGRGDYRAVFEDRQGGFRSIPRYMLPSHELSFAMTVHKSQGSEYDQVLMVLPDDENNRLLVKEIVYTGLTRAKLLAVILGKEDILKKAISQKAERETGPGLW